MPLHSVYILNVNTCRRTGAEKLFDYQSGDKTSWTEKFLSWWKTLVLFKILCEWFPSLSENFFPKSMLKGNVRTPFLYWWRKGKILIQILARWRGVTAGVAWCVMHLWKRRHPVTLATRGCWRHCVGQQQKPGCSSASRPGASQAVLEQMHSKHVGQGEMEREEEQDPACIK